MQATIRYLSIVSPDPERLACFYTAAFGMRELGRSGGGDGNHFVHQWALQ